MAGLKDITGQQFGRLTVKRFHSLSKVKQATWECVCVCGAVRVVLGAKLRNGHTTSCGCYHAERRAASNRKHGMSKSPTYKSWLHMRDRCTNPKNAKYPRYGARGITICERWNDFTNFLADMGIKPPRKTIDRIDNDGNYEPDNCRWATNVEQGNNTSTNRMLTAHGRTMNLQQWAAFLGRSRTTIERRLRAGVPIESALSQQDRRMR